MNVARLARTIMITGSAVLIGGTAALAQQGIPASALDTLPVTVRLSAPPDGAAVGRTVTFSGTAKPGVGLNLAIDGQTYVDPRDRGAQAGRGASIPVTADAGGRFSFTADLSGSEVTVDSRGATGGVSAGSHRFVVFELYAPDAGKSQAVTLDVDGAVPAATTGTAGTVTAAAPTPTPTPSASPSPTAAPAAVKGVRSFADVWPILVAAVLGGLAGAGGYRLFHRR